MGGANTDESYKGILQAVHGMADTTNRGLHG